MLDNLAFIETTCLTFVILLIAPYLLIEHEQAHLVSLNCQLEPFQLDLIIVRHFLLILPVLLPELSLSFLWHTKQLLLKVHQLFLHLSQGFLQRAYHADLICWVL